MVILKEKVSKKLILGTDFVGVDPAILNEPVFKKFLSIFEKSVNFELTHFNYIKKGVPLYSVSFIGRAKASASKGFLQLKPAYNKDSMRGFLAGNDSRILNQGELLLKISVYEDFISLTDQISRLNFSTLEKYIYLKSGGSL